MAQRLFYLKLMICFTLTAMVLSGSAACSQQLTSRLLLTVTDQYHQPIPGALAQLDGTTVGTTDALGKLNTTIALHPSNSHNLKISAHSEDLHIAPFQLRLTTQHIHNHEVVIGAMLFTLAKHDRRPFVSLPVIAQPTSQPDPKPIGPVPLTTVPLPLDTQDHQSTDHRTATPGSESPPETAAELPATRVTPPPVAADPPLAKPHSTRQLSASAPPRTTLAQLHELAQSSSLEGRRPGDLKLSVYQAEPTQPHRAPQPLKGVRIYLGFQKSIHLFCETSSHGHCFMNPKERLGRVVTLILQKPGYVTQSFKIQLAHNEDHKFTLTQGASLDVLALTSYYGSTLGIADIKIHQQGAPIGQTNSFGYFSLPITATASPPPQITLHHHGLIPAQRTINIAKLPTEPIIVPYLHRAPELVRLALFQPELLARQKQHSLQLTTALNLYHKSLRSQVFRSKLIRRVGYEKAHSATSAEFSFQTAARHGWHHKELATWLDVFLMSFIYPKHHGWRSAGNTPSWLETRIYESSKGLLASIHTPLTLPLLDKNNLTSRAVSTQVRASLPYQGTIIAIKDDSYTLNLGFKHRPDHAPGRLAQVYRLQPQPLNTPLLSKVPIGELMIKQRTATESVARVHQASATTPMAVGDLVVFHPQSTLKPVRTDLMIMAAGSAQPLAQVNLYHHHDHVGYTDHDGYVLVNQQFLNSDRTYTMMLPGYEVMRRNLTLKRSRSLPERTQPNIPTRTIMLTQLHSFIKLNSYPSGLTTRVGGTVLGQTPLAIVRPPTTTMDIAIEPPSGYKPIRRSIDLTEPFIDLTGAQTLRLERDFLARYQSLLDAGNPTKAAKVLELIPAHHSDYGTALAMRARRARDQAQPHDSLLLSYQLLDYLSKTQHSPTTTQLEALVAAGMLSFDLASNLDRQKNFTQSNALYSRTVDFLKFSQPHLAATGSPELARLHYHLNLAIHRKALILRDKTLLQVASRGWASYLNSFGKDRPVPTDPQSAAPPDPLFTQATLYAGQAERDLKRF